MRHDLEHARALASGLAAATLGTTVAVVASGALAWAAGAGAATGARGADVQADDASTQTVGASTADDATGGILFTDDTPAGTDLYVLDPDSGARRVVTGSPSRVEAQGDWSPDLGSIAYTVQSGANWQLETMDLTSLERSGVTAGPEDFEPDWSLDGSRLLFTAYFNRNTPDQASFLMTVPARGGSATPLVALYNPAYYIGNPRWSPNGSDIVFTVGGPADGAELYSAAADGTGVQRLLSHPGWDDIDPAWSPDGSRIAFASGAYRGSTAATRHDIWLLDVALGVAGTVIVDDERDLRRPAWSPDGGRLAFDARAMGGGGTLGIHVAPALGGPAGDAVTKGRDPDWAGSVAPTATPPVAGTATVTPEASPPPATASPPAVTDLPPVPTIPPFPTIPPPEPTDPWPPPTFPRPTVTPEPLGRAYVPVAANRFPLAERP